MKVYAVVSDIEDGRWFQVERIFLNKQDAENVVSKDKEVSKEYELRRMESFGCPERFNPNYDYGNYWIVEFEVE
jgi:hypothetical protein